MKQTARSSCTTANHPYATLVSKRPTNKHNENGSISTDQSVGVDTKQNCFQKETYAAVAAKTSALLAFVNNPIDAAKRNVKRPSKIRRR